MQLSYRARLRSNVSPRSSSDSAEGASHEAVRKDLASGVGRVSFLRNSRAAEADEANGLEHPAVGKKNMVKMLSRGPLRNRGPDALKRRVLAN